MLDLDFSVGRFKSHGYIQLDAADFRQDSAGPLETDFRRGPVGEADADRARDLGGGPYLRRARLGGEGTFGGRFAYRAMFEMGGNGRGQAKVAEAWISYSGFKSYTLQAGAYPPPSNMGDAASNDSTLFMERATSVDLSRNLGGGDGRLSVTLRRADRRQMWAVSVTGSPIDHAEDFAPRSALVGRWSRTMYADDATSIHFGGSGTYVLQPANRKMDGAAGFPVRFRYEPEVRAGSIDLIDTGDIAAQHANVIGAEFAVLRRNLYMQAEAFRLGVERKDGEAGDDPHFFGFYVQGSWILTGETRRFDQARGAFLFPKPRRPIGKGGWGAWELALRYSYMDLDHDAGRAGAAPPPGGIRGGEQTILSGGLEWYPMPRVRLMLNYLNVKVDRLNPAGPDNPEPFGPAPGTPPVGAQIGQAMDILAVRLRYGF